MRGIRMAAVAVIMTLAFSGLGLARDHDDDKWRHDHDKHADRDWRNDHDRDHDRWREHERHEQWEPERRGWWHRDHDRDDWRWRNNRDNGYYRGGYGYPAGGAYGYPSGGYGYPSGGYGNNGYNIGYQDGSYQARKDMAEHKPFNPNPRGDSHGTHGYSGYGDVNAYRSQYTNGYRSGYQANFRGGYRGWGF
jgi:hypothetical protein